MAQYDKKDLWCYRKAAPSLWTKKIVLAALVVAGVLSILNLFDWWFREEHIASVFLFLVLSFIFWWGMIRVIILWTSYLKITVPENIAAGKDLRVAIFTTSSPGEPASMFEKTLAACANITYPHTTYLLDDTQDSQFKEIAEKNGAVWLELVGLPGAKAGKINEALKRTKEDFILVLDPDHIPFPNFFDEVLGYFKDEKVGFVQVAQAYYNQYRSFTAKAAAEQTYSFYGPTLIGMHGVNCAVVIGSNCTFRRKALDSIGGHGHGLAEDLNSSIRMHAKGWKSVYAPVIVSRGLVPEDLGSFCKQQLKWARGVHEILFAELPRLWRKLSFWQKLSYSMTGTYYISGFITFIFLIIPFLFLFFGWLPANMDFVEFLVRWVPIALISSIIYLYVQQWLCHPGEERGLHWRGMLLKFACWPVFMYGFLLSLWNGKIPFIPTSKRAVKGITKFTRPLFIHQILFIALMIYEVVQRGFYTPQAGISLTAGEIWGMVAFSLIAFLMSFGGVYAAYQSRNLKAEDPWKEVNLENIKWPQQALLPGEIKPTEFLDKKEAEASDDKSEPVDKSLYTSGFQSGHQEKGEKQKEAIPTSEGSTVVTEENLDLYENIITDDCDSGPENVTMPPIGIAMESDENKVSDKINYEPAAPVNASKKTTEEEIREIMDFIKSKTAKNK